MNKDVLLGVRWPFLSSGTSLADAWTWPLTAPGSATGTSPTDATLCRWRAARKSDQKGRRAAHGPLSRQQVAFTHYTKRWFHFKNARMWKRANECKLMCVADGWPTSRRTSGAVSTCGTCLSGGSTTATTSGALRPTTSHPSVPSNRWACRHSDGAAAASTPGQ